MTWFELCRVSVKLLLPQKTKPALSNSKCSAHISKNKRQNNNIFKMNQECLCDCESEVTLQEEKDPPEDSNSCNRIFLNFTREQRRPPTDYRNTAKVKELFKCLSERQDLQEMKVSGWLDDEKPEENREESEGEDLLESYRDERSSPRGKGQRFAMSRDFWYRKLNTLKAQKLDETALEAKDLPSDSQKIDLKWPKGINGQKILSSEIAEKPEKVFGEIDEFDRTVAKPVEKELKKRFINVYDNKKQLNKDCN